MKYFIHFSKKECKLNSSITLLCIEHLRDFPISNESETDDPSKICETPFEKVLATLNITLSKFIYFDCEHHEKILTEMDQAENGITNIDEAQEFYRHMLTIDHQSASSLVRIILSSLNQGSEILNQQFEHIYSDILGYFMLLNAILSLNLAIIRLSNTEIKLILEITKIWRDNFEEVFLPKISNKGIKPLFEKFKQNCAECIKSIDTQLIPPENPKPLPQLNASGQFPFDWHTCLIEAFDAVIIDDEYDSKKKLKCRI